MDAIFTNDIHVKEPELDGGVLCIRFSTLHPVKSSAPHYKPCLFLLTESNKKPLEAMIVTKKLIHP